jgi:4-hydroxy-2-oxoglutarate aldolase
MMREGWSSAYEDEDSRMDHNRVSLSGVFASIVTPFAGDELDLDALAYNVARLRRTDLKGFLVLGTSGEYESLTDEERLLVLKVLSEERGDKVVMVGTGRESTRETIEKCHVAGQMGFDYVCVLPPHFYPAQIDGAALERHYERIAETVSVPVLLYNAPQHAAGVHIPRRVVRELSKHQNIVGMNDCSIGGPALFMAGLDPEEDFLVLAGAVGSFYPSLHTGVVGAALTLAGIMPEACAELYDLFARGMYERAKDLNAGLIRLDEIVSGNWGVAGLKAAMDLVGLRGGRPREPLMPASGDAVAQIKQALVSEGFVIA